MTPRQLLVDDHASGGPNAGDDAAVKALKGKFFRLATEELEFNARTRGRRFPKLTETDDLQAYIREFEESAGRAEQISQHLLTE